MNTYVHSTKLYQILILCHISAFFKNIKQYNLVEAPCIPFSDLIYFLLYPEVTTSLSLVPHWYFILLPRIYVFIYCSAYFQSVYKMHHTLFFKFLCSTFFFGHFIHTDIYIYITLINHFN